MFRSILQIAQPEITTEEKGVIDELHHDEYATVEGRAGNIREAHNPPTPGGIPADILAAVYKQSPVIQRAISIGADACRLVIPRVYRKQGGRSVEVTSGYPYKLIRFVNPHMTISDLLAIAYADERVFGSSFVAIEETAKGYEKESAVSLHPMRPQYVTVVTDPDTKYKAYIYDNGKQQFFFPASRVLHSTQYSPDNYYLGQSSINAVEYDLQIERYAKKSMRNFQSQAAVISGVITSKTEIGPDEIRRLKKEFYEQYSGARNAYRVLVLENDMQYQPLKASDVDSHIVEIIKESQTNGAMVMGVPMGLIKPDSAANAAAIDKLESLFWRVTLLPWLEKYKGVMDKKLCLPVESAMPASKAANIEIKFDLSHVQALKRENLDEMRTHVAAINVGLNSPNEIRDRRGDDPWPEEYSEFANAPYPWLSMQYGTAGQPGVSPSVTLPGSEGGRDQSATGEAQMVDETGTR